MVIKSNIGNQNNTNHATQIGVYKKHTIRRSISRQIGVLINHKKIQKNNDVQILVCLHLYYMHSWAEIEEYLKNLSPYSYDLYISYQLSTIVPDIMANVKLFKPDVHFVCCENKGFDVGPFFEILNSVNLNKYDIVFKIHTKGTARSFIRIYKQLFRKRDWFLNLFEGVLGPFTVHKTIDALFQQSRVGLVAASNLIVEDPPHKQQFVQNFSDEHNIIVPDHYRFVAGTCFAIKAELLKNLQSLGIGIDGFGESSRGVFSSAHSLERVLCFNIQNHGYTFLGNRVCVLRRARWAMLARYLNKRSSTRLLQDTRFSLDNEFFYMALETALIERYELIEIPLKDIRRMWIDSNTYRLDECAPYRYLLGDNESYEQYCLYHQQNNLPYMTQERFDSLIQSIDANGYNPHFVIVLDQNNIIYDGQHRACYLMHKYGGDYRVPVLKITSLTQAHPMLHKFYKNIFK